MEGQSLWIPSCSNRNEDEDAESGQHLPWHRAGPKAQVLPTVTHPAGHSGSLQLTGWRWALAGSSCSGPSVFSPQARGSPLGALWGTQAPPHRAPSRARPLTHEELSKDWVPGSGAALQSRVAACASSPPPNLRRPPVPHKGTRLHSGSPTGYATQNASVMVFEKGLRRSGRGSGDEVSWKGLGRQQAGQGPVREAAAGRMKRYRPGPQ